MLKIVITCANMYSIYLAKFYPDIQLVHGVKKRQIVLKDKVNQVT